MEDLMNVVDWSRAQFALTAMVHWLFVPLTIGLSLIVAVMETMWYRTREQKWLVTTKLWMKLFGINFACGVATGIILEFEFGTNWSNYSWFVGDIFGAPLAIEGIFAFFMESTFVAVMFFGWKKVSSGFHLAATWLTALGVILSALWILVANAWMQYPVGMEFDPEQMRNVMTDFGAVALSPVAINKFFHTVSSGWVLGAVFVVGVSCYLLLKGRNHDLAMSSIKVAGWTGLAGILVTIWTGDGSAVEMARVQPMKLAAMEGLYDGERGQGLVALGMVNPDKQPGDQQEALLWGFEIPRGLSFLAKHDGDAFVPGINDLINGIEINEKGDTVRTVSYAERIEAGHRAQAALGDYEEAHAAGDSSAMADAVGRMKADYQYFGYGYLDSPEDAVPPVALTFYAFRVMVIAGGYLLAFFAFALFMAYKRPSWLDNRLVLLAGVLTILVVWVCSEAGWVVAEVGRQPWVVQDLMPARAAVSAIESGGVKLTFWIFTVIFSVLLAAEWCIMLSQIKKDASRDIMNDKNN